MHNYVICKNIWNCTLSEDELYHRQMMSQNLTEKKKKCVSKKVLGKQTREYHNTREEGGLGWNNRVKKNHKKSY